MAERVWENRHRNVQLLGVAIAVVIAGVSSLVLLGWCTGVESLTRPAPWLPATHPLTAICMLLVVGALLIRYRLQASRHQSGTNALLLATSVVFAGVPLVCGILQLTAWALRWEEGPDAWLFPSLSQNTGAAIARMSAVTSLMMVLLSLPLVIQSRQYIADDTISWACAMLVLSLSAVSMLGYLVGAEALYGYFTSVITSLLVGGLSVSLFIANGGSEWIAKMHANRFVSTTAKFVVPFTACAAAGFLLVDNLVDWLAIRQVQSIVFLHLAALSIVGCTFTSQYIYRIKQLHDVIVDQNRSLQELRDENQKNMERVRAIFEVAVDGIVTIDPQGMIHLFNPAAEKLFGYTAEEVAGKNVKMLMPNPYQSEHDGYLKAYRDTGVKQIIGVGREAMARRKDGTTFPIELAVSEMSLPHQVGFVGVVRDITTRKLAEDKMHRANETLKQSNAELEHFAYIASHDLQEPLRKISAYCGLLKEEKGEMLDDEACDYLDVAMRGAERLSHLVRDLLTFSRITTRGKPLRFVDAELCLSEAIGNLEVTIDESGAEISYGQLPMVMADSSQLTQLFQNLISNAIKYCEAVPPQISISGKDLGNTFEFAVSDNGIGIEERFHERIFQIFQRLHNRREYSGTGIGLALCKKIVERSGGKMWVASVPGEGSTFYFTMKSTADQGEDYELSEQVHEPHGLIFH